jgi:hypothetical protein
MSDVCESLSFELADQGSARNAVAPLRALLHRVLEDANALGLSVGPWFIDSDLEMSTRWLRLVTHDDVDPCATAILVAAQRAGKPLWVRLSADGSWLVLQIVIAPPSVVIRGQLMWLPERRMFRSAQAIADVVDAWRRSGLVRPADPAG